ncbi:hypothetical protein CLHOM_11630 [Clostridium homopropionicum DSM 5847]|jgi:hypothetical protein|uniref:Restriction endonuclease n=1 Tax=Clostridium homopropionicum DSM 5847 TaxID=1121318 RepID=A0A0L6ZC79_9CLOT|nr:hypothetical protein [Clostridium homopropionicum]KOA20575.1 hypothetical protein CLHOM_11630 [Clostridium homopropionicum DSM 5847]SFG39427.1 hypothetical protein SAMN04488501_108168 [Clostridium homopropionicum]
MKPRMTIENLINEAKIFCEKETKINHTDLLGVTDGKAVGTYVEHKFKNFLKQKYELEIGNSASGIDLPSRDINTDIKVTSVRQPQSSCPFKSARQKIFGLGYNLIVFVYEKIDTENTCTLNFVNCTYIDKLRTADFTTTKRILEMLEDGANKEDLIAYFQDRGIPGDEITHNDLADEVLRRKPLQGYLTISNALQWRLQYGRVIGLNNKIEGVINFDWK